MAPRTTSRLLLIALLGALGYGLYLRTLVLAEPFVHGHLGTGACHIANFVRNSLRYGLVETKFSKVDNLGPTDPAHFRYAVNHPPLTPLLYVPLALVSGQREWGFRLTALAFVLVGWWALFVAARRLRGVGFATLVVALGSGVAMAAFYDVHVDVQGPDVTAFALLAFLGYLQWSADGRRQSLVGFLIGLLLAMLTGWPAYYLAFAIVFDLVVFRPRAGALKLAAYLGLGTATMIVLYMAYVGMLKNNDPGAGLSVLENASKFRSPLMLGKLLEDPDNRARFDYFISQTFARVKQLYTLPGLAFAGIGLISILVRGLRRRWLLADRAFLMLLWFGGLHPAIFLVGAIIHDYWWKYLVPAFVWSAAEGILLLARWLGRTRALWRAVACAACVAAVLVSSWPTLQAFYAEDTRSAWVMGIEAKRRTDFAEVVLCGDIPAVPVLRYYVDRYLEIRVNDVASLAAALKRFGTSAALWIGSESQVSKGLKPLADYLRAHYQYETVEGNLLVDLRQPRRLNR